MALTAYLRRFIVSKGEALIALAHAIESLQTREDYAKWFKAARMADLDPTD